jgi:hypothetical protein
LTILHTLHTFRERERAEERKGEKRCVALTSGETATTDDRHLRATSGRTDGRTAVLRHPWETRVFLADRWMAVVYLRVRRQDDLVPPWNPGHDDRPLFPLREIHRNVARRSRYLVDAVRLVSRELFMGERWKERRREGRSDALFTHARVRLRSVATRTGVYLSRVSVISAADLCAYTAIFNLLLHAATHSRGRDHARTHTRARESARKPFMRTQDALHRVWK